MKKIIKNKVYDTATAKFCGCYDNGRTDFATCSETLYQKKTGEYFLYGEGGPMSKYAVHHGNDTSGSEVITPLTYLEAQEWAEEHLDGDEYEAIFGPVIEGNKQALNLNISASSADKLKKLSARTGKSVSAIIEEYAETL